jgi:hypothetical protein
MKADETLFDESHEFPLVVEAEIRPTLTRDEIQRLANYERVITVPFTPVATLDRERRDKRRSNDDKG